jgi:hypothetical protein
MGEVESIPRFARNLILSSMAGERRLASSMTMRGQRSWAAWASYRAMCSEPPRWG